MAAVGRRRARATTPAAVTTLEGARRFVLRERMCTVLTSRREGVRSLWDAVALPDKKPGEKGWGRKMVAVWTWKTQLPARYPDEIFYGKIPGGLAVLMSLDYLRNEHYPKWHRELAACSPLAQRMYELVRLDVYETGELRRECIERLRCSRAQFERALKELQVTLNIVRSNDPEVEADTWLPFRELYPTIHREHAAGAGDQS